MRAVLDKSLFGDHVIVTKTLDGAKHAAQFKLEGPCESRSTNHSKGPNLTALCTSDFQVSSTEANVISGSNYSQLEIHLFWWYIDFDWML